jgi:hypothetical protein
MRARLPVILALGISFGACSGDLISHPHGFGEVAWTIEGRSDPSLCSDHGARFVHVVVHNADDAVAEDDWTECRDLSEEYVLRRGWHRASLTLTDATRAPLVARDSERFYVERHVRVVVDLTPPTIDVTAQAARR